MSGRAVVDAVPRRTVGFGTPIQFKPTMPRGSGAGMLGIEENEARKSRKSLKTLNMDDQDAVLASFKLLGETK